MRKIIMGIVMSALTIAVLAGSASARTTTRQRFLLVSAGNPRQPGKVIASGPVTRVGIETETDGPNGDVLATFTFDTGVVSVDLSGVRQSNFDPATCIAKPTESGTFTITGHSGIYSGVTGGGTYSGHGITVGSRGTQGQCFGPGSGIPPALSVFIARMAGTVSIPS